MSKKRQKLLGAIICSLLFAILIAYVGGYRGQEIGSMSIFSLVVIIAFILNWIAYIPAILAQTEHYYDLIGAATYLTVIVVALWLSSNLDVRAYLASIMVIVWALRLGSYLYLRVKRTGRDGRFDEMKTKPLNFFVAWTMQALWVVITAACALVIITSEQRESISWLGIVGLSVWLFGLTIEIVADHQKSKFKSNPENAKNFISHGLWAWSQHPNYFGEVVLWIGMAIFALPILSGLQWFCLISPVFVYVLLRYVSGVNLSHEIGDQRWGQDPDYLSYRQNTSVMILKVPRKGDNN